MNRVKPLQPYDPVMPGTTLLACDDKKSVIVEVVGGQINGLAYCAYGHQSARKAVEARSGFNAELRNRQVTWYFLGNGYRAYNPRLMRFHSPDSWSPFERGGINGYLYCAGNPVMNSDPSGHSIVGTLVAKAWNLFEGLRTVSYQSADAAVTASKAAADKLASAGAAVKRYVTFDTQALEAAKRGGRFPKKHPQIPASASKPPAGDDGYTNRTLIRKKVVKTREAHANRTQIPVTPANAPGRYTYRTEITGKWSGPDNPYENRARPRETNKRIRFLM